MLFVRAILASLAFGLANSLAFPIASALLPRTEATPFLASVLALGSGALAAVLAWRHGPRGASDASMGRYMLQGGFVTGAVGFIGGFFGPMVLAPDANQGPMLGLFITGPGGFVLGALAGAIYWLARGRPAA